MLARLCFSIFLLAALNQHAIARDLPPFLFGVTSDNPWRTGATKKAIEEIGEAMIVRIVFDEFIAAKEYGDIPRSFSKVAYVMGEILDSAYFRRYSRAGYRDRMLEYLDAFDDDVDLWEIGNEVNGEWLGATSDVVEKISDAYDIVKGRGGRTALTLYLNTECSDADHEMFRWAVANVPRRIKDGVDYVLVSYYEDDCNGWQPDWQDVFDRLGEIFPTALMGVSECGTSRRRRAPTYIERYYTMDLRVDHPRFVGGYFWWYFNGQMVPWDKEKKHANWEALADAIRAASARVR